MTSSEKEIYFKLLSDEKIIVERMSEEELAYLTRRVVRLCNAQRVGNSRGVIKMWIVSTVLVSLFSLMSMVYDSDGGSLQWAASPNISYLDVDSPIESSKVEDAIDYVVWSWGSRIPGLGIKYVGLTLGPIENAIITYRWLGFVDHFSLTNNLSSKGAEQKWVYLDSGYIARSVISLNTSFFKGNIGACDLVVFSHELGHALGAPHSDNPNDLMYWAPAHCRPTPTDSDVRLTGNIPVTCHAELTKSYDLFLPEINGKEAYLKYKGEYVWSVDYVAEKSPRVCVENRFDQLTGELWLDSIHGRGESYSAKFKAIDDNMFQLIYAK